VLFYPCQLIGIINIIDEREGFYRLFFSVSLLADEKYVKIIGFKNEKGGSVCR